MLEYLRVETPQDENARLLKSWHDAEREIVKLKAIIEKFEAENARLKAEVYDWRRKAENI